MHCYHFDSTIGKSSQWLISLASHSRSKILKSLPYFAVTCTPKTTLPIQIARLDKLLLFHNVVVFVVVVVVVVVGMVPHPCFFWKVGVLSMKPSILDHSIWNRVHRLQHPICHCSSRWRLCKCLMNAYIHHVLLPQSTDVVFEWLIDPYIQWLGKTCTLTRNEIKLKACFFNCLNNLLSLVNFERIEKQVRDNSIWGALSLPTASNTFQPSATLSQCLSMPSCTAYSASLGKL